MKAYVQGEGCTPVHLKVNAHALSPQRLLVKGQVMHKRKECTTMHLIMHNHTLKKITILSLELKNS